MKQRKNRSQESVDGLSGQTSRSIAALFPSYKDCHKGKTFLVCGCGSSLSQLYEPQKFITIGVNDVGRQFDPDYLVVLNSRNQFKHDRFHYVEQSRARALFTQLSLGVRHPNIVRFKLGQRGGTDCSDTESLPFTRNSPYVALCLAIYMGARRIGLIGVDFTEHHFFAKSGTHPLSKGLSRINDEYKKLGQTAQKLGIEIVNLSQQSRISAFPKQSPEDFYQGHPSGKVISKNEQPLNIVSYSTTPVAGVPEILARCINEQTIHQCSCVWASNDYGNGVKFNSAIEWSRQPEAAIQQLRQADLIILHNGKVDARHRSIIDGKPVVTMAHNYLWNVGQDYINRGYPGVVVAQYQATLDEFNKWDIVPNPIAVSDYRESPGRKNSQITICYTPSGRHDVYPQGHRLYWHSKGYASTMAILEKLAKRYPLTLEVIREQQLSHQQVMAMKRRAHIVIDECVTGSYHRNSLEGLASGCVVVNGLGILPGVKEVLARCIGDAPSPFIGCNLQQLEGVLVELIESGLEQLSKHGADNRLWMQQHWDFSDQWRKFWYPVVEKALAAHAQKHSAGTLSARAVVAKPASVKVKASTRARPSVTIPKSDNAAIPVYWTCRNSLRGNFGDMLSPLLTRALSGRPVVFRNTAPRLFAVGSLLKFASKGDRVWGTGFIDQQDSVTPGVIIHAVRGPLTRKKLLAQGVDCPEVYGDPGLLLPAIYPAKNTVRRGIGIIPHYVDLDRVRKEVRQPGVRIIDIRAGIDKVLQQALSCEVILSSSLHGCILADAYGIPHRWVEIGDKVVGSGFKFRDYYASTNRDPAAVDWRRSIDIDTAVKMALDMPPPEIDLGSLVKSFPYLMKHSEKFTKLTLPYANNKNYDAMPNLAASVSQKVAIQEVHNPQAEIKSSGNDSARPEVINDKIAIFGAVTENYVEYMIASLRSFKKYNGDDDFDYFIIGHAFSARTQRLMNKYGIGYINLSLAEDFPRKQRHRYPGECFWIFKGPELFSDRGYRYSISVDGDVYCNRKLELEWLPQLEHLAGIDRGCSCGEFLQNLGQLDAITRKLGSAGLNSRRRATNTGVLFYNNSELVAKNFYQHIVDIYQRSEKAGIVRGGDDSTLAMLLALHADIKMHMLPNVWNFYQGMNKQQTSVDAHKELELKKQVQDAFIVHLIHMKPWRHYSKFPNPWVHHYIGEWRKLWPATRNQRRIQALNRVQDYRNDRLIKSRNRAANQCANEGTLPIAVYWYRGVHLNMGDEITPYLLAKIEGLMPEEIPRLTKEPARTSGLVLVSIGSVLRLCHKNTLIWGSGIRTIDQPVAKAYRFCAVRGPLTRRRLLQLGYDCPEIYGDPALLLPRYYRPQVSRKYDLGIIPHLVDYDQLIKRYGADKNVLVIDVKTGDIESIIRQILSCKVTVSSSLHGIVLSVAYGIPTRWLKCSDKIMGDDSKFYDFFASLEPAMLDVFDERTVTIVAEESRYEKFKPLRIHSSDMTPKQLIAATHKYESVLDLDLLLNAYPGEYLTCLKKMA